MAREIVRGSDLYGKHFTYEKVDGKFTENEGHGKTQQQADKDFVESTKIKNATK